MITNTQMIDIFTYTTALTKPDYSECCRRNGDREADKHSAYQNTRTEIGLAVARGLLFVNFLLESMAVFGCVLSYIRTISTPQQSSL